MKEYELSQIIKDKSGQKDKNTERQKDRKTKIRNSNTQDSEDCQTYTNELRSTNMNMG